jgi:hypothetical protein
VRDGSGYLDSRQEERAAQSRKEGIKNHFAARVGGSGSSGFLVYLVYLAHWVWGTK